MQLMQRFAHLKGHCFNMRHLIKYIPFVRTACREDVYLNPASLIFSCFYTDNEDYVFYRGMFLGFFVAVIVSYSIHLYRF